MKVRHNEPGRSPDAAYTCTSCGFATALCVCSDGPRNPETQEQVFVAPLDEIKRLRIAPEPTLSERRELLVHLRWASRANPNSPSRNELRKLFERPDVLNYIEKLVANAEA